MATSAEDPSADYTRAIMVNDRAITGSLAATDDVVTIVTESHQAVVVVLTGTWGGTITPQVSPDGGTTWVDVDFYDLTYKKIVSNTTTNGAYIILRTGGSSQARVIFTRTSGTATAALRATFAWFIYNEAAGPGNTALPPQAILIGGSDGTNLQLIRVAADNADALAVLTTANVVRVIAENFGFNGTSWDRLTAGNVSNKAAATGLLNTLAAGRYDAVRVALTDGRFSAFQLGSQGALDVGLRNPDATGALFPASAAAADGFSNPTISHVGADLLIFNGTTWDRARTGAAQDTGLTAGIQAVHEARIANTPTTTVAGQTLVSLQDLSLAGARVVSGDNAAATIIIDSRNLHTGLSIYMAASAGTATVDVSVSVDNSNYLTIDSLLAAATRAKDYTIGAVGATIAISPLNWRYIKIVIGAAGAGNTTTTNIGMK